MATHGTFWWNELMTRNVEQAKAFYTATLGWSFDPMQMPDGGTYWIVMSGDTTVGGLFDISPSHYDGVPSAWFSYIAVDDVDACAATVSTAGGKVERPPFNVPGVGRIAIISDPSGAHVGLATPAPAMA